MAAVVIQLGVLSQQLLGIIGQIEGGVIGHRLDAQRLADLHDGIERRTADAVVEGAVDGGQGHAHRKGKLPHAPVLPRDLVTNNGSQIIHNTSSTHV